LQVIAQLYPLYAEGIVSVEDVVDCTNDLLVDVVKKVLQWANLLSLANPVGQRYGQELWYIDPVVGRILAAIEE